MPKKTSSIQKAEKWVSRYGPDALKYASDKDGLFSFLRSAYLNGYWAGKRNEAEKRTAQWIPGTSKNASHGS